MKTLLSVRAMLAVFALTLLLNACKEQDSVGKLNQGESFFVKDIERRIITQLDPQILNLVRKNLTAKGRLSDAENLLRTYDFKSGKILSTVTLPLNSARAASAYSVAFDSYSRNIGWRYNIPLGGTLGVTGQSLRLEGFKINLNPYTDGPSSIQAEAHIQGSGWQGVRNPGDYIGTLGQSKAIQAARFYVNPNFATQVLYRAHVANIGWMNWVSNGETAGTEGQNRDMEGLEVTMLVY
jgi:uncharacterized protein YjdB